MKTTKKIISAVLVLTLVFALTGCTNKSKTIVGKWSDGTYTYEFNSDGTGSCVLGAISVNITNYKLEKDKIIITISFLEAEQTDEYEYSLTKDTLILTQDGKDRELKKQ